MFYVCFFSFFIWETLRFCGDIVLKYLSLLVLKMLLTAQSSSIPSIVTPWLCWDDIQSRLAMLAVTEATILEWTENAEYALPARMVSAGLGFDLHVTRCQKLQAHGQISQDALQTVHFGTSWTPGVSRGSPNPNEEPQQLQF